MPELLPEIGQVDWGDALNTVLGSLDTRTTAVEASTGVIDGRVDALEAATADLPTLQAEVDDIESAWTPFTPVVRAGGVAYTYSAGVARGAYKVIGKTLLFNINITGDPTGGGGTGAITVDLPGGHTTAARDQVATSLLGIASPPAGYNPSQPFLQLLSASTTNIPLLIFAFSSGGGSTASLTSTNGLHQLFLSGAVEIA